MRRSLHQTLCILSALMGTLIARGHDNVTERHIPVGEYHPPHAARSSQDIMRELIAARTKPPPKGLLTHDPLTSLFTPWTALKEDLKERYCLELGLSYSVIYLRATEGPSYREAASDRFKFYGSWHLLGAKPGWQSHLGFRYEIRHRYTPHNPEELSEAIGSLWNIAYAYGQFIGSLVQLWWEQHLFWDTLMFRVGKIDPTDFYDTYRFDSGEKYFVNEVLSGNVVLPYPDNGPAFILSLNPSKDYHLAAGISDANAQETTTGIRSLGDSRFLYAAEFGYSPLICGWGRGMYHVSLWYIDPSKASNEEYGRGYAISFQQPIGEHITPFIRFSHAGKTARPVKQTGCLGVGLERLSSLQDDWLGIAAGWGKPTDAALRDQYVAEVVYRVQLTHATQLSADLQLLVHPSNAPNDDFIGLFGVRTLIIY